MIANYNLGPNYDRSLKKSLKEMIVAEKLSKPKGIGLIGSFKFVEPKVEKKPKVEKLVKNYRFPK